MHPETIAGLVAHDCDCDSADGGNTLPAQGEFGKDSWICQTWQDVHLGLLGPWDSWDENVGSASVVWVLQSRLRHAPDFGESQREADSPWVLQELVPGSVELSVSMLVSAGSILDVVGMRYTYDTCWQLVESGLLRLFRGISVWRQKGLAEFEWLPRLNSRTGVSTSGPMLSS